MLDDEGNERAARSDGLFERAAEALFTARTVLIYGAIDAAGALGLRAARGF